MSTTSDSIDRALALVRLLGITQEARRLRATVIGTEHLLVATLADPVVRWAVLRAGVELRSVQELVNRESAGRAHSPTGTLELTPPAADVITRAAAKVPTLSPDRRPEPPDFSAVLGWIMTTLLRDEQNTAARRILDELGLRHHACALIAAVHDNAGPSAVRPDLPPR